jgi:hypothetical protein
MSGAGAEGAEAESSCDDEGSTVSPGCAAPEMGAGAGYGTLSHSPTPLAAPPWVPVDRILHVNAMSSGAFFGGGVETHRWV